MTVDDIVKYFQALNALCGDHVYPSMSLTHYQHWHIHALSICDQMERDISTAGVRLLIEGTAQFMVADNDGQMRTIFRFPGICPNNYNASDDKIYCNYLCKF